MANYYATSRSNYFEVKDLNNFEKEIEEIPSITLIQEDKKICLLFEDGEGVPNWIYNEETLEDEEIDWCGIFKKHLKENQVAIFQEVGAEKLRYLCGVAIAYSWTGEVVSVSLDDIYQIAAQTFGDTAQISKCIY